MIKEPRFIASELLLFGFGSDEEFEVHRNPPSFLCLFFIFFYILSLFGFETFAVPPLFVNIFLFWGFFYNRKAQPSKLLLISLFLHQLLFR